jgi:hypothetical protein
MDRTRLSAIVYKKTGIVMDPDDPAFAAIEASRLAMEEVVNRFSERLETLPERIQASAKVLASEVACQGVQCVTEALREARQTLAADSEAAQRGIAERVDRAIVQRQGASAPRSVNSQPRAGSARARWLLACAVVALASFAGGMVVGQVTTVTVFLHAETGAMSKQGAARAAP